jgi:hypothetical protein
VVGQTKTLPLITLIKGFSMIGERLVQKKEECAGRVCDRTKTSVVGQERIRRNDDEMIRGKTSIEGNVFDAPRRARPEKQI